MARKPLSSFDYDIFTQSGWIGSWHSHVNDDTLMPHADSSWKRNWPMKRGCLSTYRHLRIAETSTLWLHYRIWNGSCLGEQRNINIHIFVPSFFTTRCMRFGPAVRVPREATLFPTRQSMTWTDIKDVGRFNISILSSPSQLKSKTSQKNWNAWN